VNVEPDEADVWLGHRSGTKLEPSMLVIGLIVLLTTVTMGLFALPLGPLLRALPPLRAYAFDIGGALLGIGMFAALSLASTPPTWWVAVLAVLFGAAAIARRGGRRDAIGLGALILVVGLGAADLEAGDRWSPYYRISIYREPSGLEAISVNGIGHQSLATSDAPLPFYHQVYAWLPGRTFENALVIGAGAGNDTAVALAHGVRHVDAVEIDPEIQRIGVERHPDRPYDDPRVTRIVADGRAHLRGTTSTYDLIVFAQTDSLTLVTNTANLRLESFLFTDEAFRDAHARLRPGGVIVLYNHYREEWLVMRYAAMVERVFGMAPHVRTYPEVRGGTGLAVIAAGRDGLPPAADLERWSTADPPAPVTDDRPFPYLRAPGIPPGYALPLFVLVAAAVVLVLCATRSVGTSGMDAHFFLLGAAFLLLETRSLATFSLLFGTTWYVNALVFAAILGSVLVATIASMRLPPLSARAPYVTLFGALGVAYFVDPSALLFEPAWLRYTVASVIAFAPIAAANLVFARSFRDAARADVALGWNLIGAVCGGVLEYAALVVGYRQLLLVVAALYLAAELAARRWAAHAPSHPSEAVAARRSVPT
jgi:spermidine synthase